MDMIIELYGNELRIRPIQRAWEMFWKSLLNSLPISCPLDAGTIRR